MTVVDPFLPSPKTRTWRGRVAKQFRKIQHHNSHHSSQQRNSASSLAEVNTTYTDDRIEYPFIVPFIFSNRPLQTLVLF
jgi:hypothetical protein